MASQPTTTPRYLAKGKTVDVPVHKLAKVLKMIDDHGQSGKFARDSKKSEAVVTLDHNAVNFIKDFVAGHPEMSKKALGKKVINPVQANAAPADYECNF
jgi:hypothetical protein